MLSGILVCLAHTIEGKTTVWKVIIAVVSGSSDSKPYLYIEGMLGSRNKVNHLIVRI